jgi:hypothetical protein
MAVILDIPMPGGCGKCPLNDDNWGCIVTGKPVQEDSRPETCPLYDLNREQALDIGIDLSRDLSWTGKVYLPKKVREKLFPPHTAPGSGPSEIGPNPTEINRADGAAARKEVT